MIQHPELKIKQIRELKNISQDYVADKLEISTRAYSKIESGETSLSIKRLNEISSALDIHPLDVLGFDDKQVFNNCTQKGNIGIVHNANVSSDKLQEQYENRIRHLEDEVVFLRAQLVAVLGN